MKFVIRLLLGAIAFLAERRDHGPLGADNNMVAQPQLMNALDDVIDIGPGRIRIHDDDHVRKPPKW